MTIVLLPLEMLQVQPSHAVWCSVLMQDGVTVSETITNMQCIYCSLQEMGFHGKNLPT